MQDSKLWKISLDLILMRFASLTDMGLYDCNGCGASGGQAPIGTWWSLRDYYGITGRFCPACYDKVAHDGFGKPRNSEEYLFMLLRVSNNARPNTREYMKREFRG
jgi:hypothetical protein